MDKQLTEALMAFRQDVMATKKESIENMVGKGKKTEQWQQLILTTVKRNPEHLLSANRQSLWDAINFAIQIDLPFDTAQQWCHLVVFKKQVKLIISYKGLCELAYRNDKVKKIWGDIVHEGDFFQFEKGTTPYIKHRYMVGGDRKTKKILCAYACVKMSDEEIPLFDIVDADTLIALDKMSQNTAKATFAQKDVHDYMKIKAALKLVLKTVPKSDSLSKALEYDNQLEGGENGDIHIIEPSGNEIVIKGAAKTAFSTLVENTLKKQQAAALSSPEEKKPEEPEQQKPEEKTEPEKVAPQNEEQSTTAQNEPPPVEKIVKKRRAQRRKQKQLF